MVDVNQILQLTNVLAPLVIGFVRERQRVGQEIPDEGTPEYAAYLAELNALVASRADAVAAEIEDMKRRHPPED